MPDKILTNGSVFGAEAHNHSVISQEYYAAFLIRHILEQRDETTYLMAFVVINLDILLPLYFLTIRISIRGRFQNIVVLEFE